MSFQKIILIVAIIVLIIMLVTIGMALSKSSDTQSWPPVIGQCPDYWVDLSGNGEACFNSHSLGKCNVPNSVDRTPVKNFNEAPYNSENGLCEKYTWANSCGVTWDGITYGVKNPCDTTTTDTTTTS